MQQQSGSAKASPRSMLNAGKNMLRSKNKLETRRKQKKYSWILLT